MRSRLPFLSAILFLVLLACAPPAKGSLLLRSSGRTILSLEVEGAKVPQDEMRTLIPYSPGLKLDPSLVREGIINLYKTGLYDRVEVLLKEEPDGVRVKYHLTPKQWLEQIRFTGNLYVDDRKLSSKVDLRRSEEITDEKLTNTIEKLLKYYRFRGFKGTEITYHREPDAKDRNLVVFSIREGTRKHISDVRLSGNAGLSRTKLISIISSMPGSRLDGEDLESDLARVRRYLRSRMYLTPVLDYNIEPDRRVPDGARVTINIERGPLFSLIVQLDDGAKSGKMDKRIQSIFRDAATPEKGKLAAEKYILDEYHLEGYPFVTVNVEDQAKDIGARAITFNVHRGPKVITGQIRVEGVRFFKGENREKTLGMVQGEPFVMRTLEEGIEKLRSEYRQEGFLAVKLNRDPIEFHPREGYMEAGITVSVEEGPRNIVGSLRVVGTTIPEERVNQLLGIKTGDPYVPESVNKARDDLLQELGGMGYLYAAATIEPPPVNPDNTVDLVISVKEGPRVRLNTIIIQGNESVDMRIIRLALDLKPGEVLTRQKILKAQERIYDLKVMSSVDVKLSDPETPGDSKDLLVQVQERAKYVVGMSIGYGSEDKLRGEFSLTNRNVMGMARSLSLSGKASDIERNTTILYTHPWFGSLPIKMTLSFSDLYEKKDSYSRDAKSAAVDFVRALSEKTELRLGYFFEGLRLYNVSPDAQLSPDDEGKTDVAALIAEVLRDTRDDFLDPRSGFIGDVILEYAVRSLGSKTEYLKTEIALHRYIPFSDSMVLAGLFRVGRVTAYGHSEEVIISKRFFLGGQNSVRGYRLDSLGPQDANGDPVGGNNMFNANLELRYPVYHTLRGVLFVDSGSVWLDNATDPEDEKFKLRAAAGAGLRWSSPIGPLSLDYGYKLNPKTDTEGRYRIHFSIGHAF